MVADMLDGRLARFNVENAEDESAHMNFAGLPSPATAGVVVSSVVLHEHFLSGSVTGTDNEEPHGKQ